MDTSVFEQRAAEMADEHFASTGRIRMADAKLRNALRALLFREVVAPGIVKGMGRDVPADEIAAAQEECVEAMARSWNARMRELGGPGSRAVH